MKTYICLFVLCLSVIGYSKNTYATESDFNNTLFDEMVQKGGFYVHDNLPLRPDHYYRAIRSTPKFKTGTYACSTVILSNDGYVATNLHCVEEFLRKHWNYDPNVPIADHKKEGSYKVFQVLNSTPHVFWPDHVKNEFSLMNYVWGKTPNSLGPDMMIDYPFHMPLPIWIGRGKQNHEETKVVDLSEDEFELLNSADEDIVILKYEPNSLPNKESVCVPVAETVAKSGDPIWVFGHPARTDRDHGLSPRGNSLHISVGRVRSDIGLDPIYQGYVSQMPTDSHQTFWNRERALWNKESILLTSADVYGGNSGGLMLNKEGEAVAVTFGLTKSAAHIYEGATSFGVRLDSLKKWVKRDLGEQMEKEIFNCPRQ